MTKNIAVFVAWPYANAPTLHIGHLVGALLPADIFARYQRMKQNNVLHVTGTDMHGTPVSIKAKKANIDTEQFAISNHNNFVNQLKTLNIDFDLYTNTHNKLHHDVVNNMGKLLYELGFLFPRTSSMLYDEQKQQYLPDRYVEGTCPHCGYSPARGDQCDNCGRILNPLELKDPVSKLSGTTPVVKQVTNLYLDLPKMQKNLEKWIEQNPRLRTHVKQMTLGFLKEGLEPRPVTRNIDWGIPVEIEGFEDQVWYVWFEAVIGYLSAPIAWDTNTTPKNATFIFNKRTPRNSTNNTNNGSDQAKKQNNQTNNFLNWEDFWKATNAYHYYFLGKDNIPFHTIIWPAQLMMYNLKYLSSKHLSSKHLNSQLTKTATNTTPQQDLFEKYKLINEQQNTPLKLAYDVPANNFLNLNNAKISKSTGNYIGLNDLLDNYETTAIRYVFSRLMPENKDADFSMQRFTDLVNNELVATIGNLIYRSLSFAKKQYQKNNINLFELAPSNHVKKRIQETFKQVDKLLNNVQLTKALEEILKLAQFGNQMFNESAPWKNATSESSKQAVLDVIHIVYNLGILLFPYTPQLSTKIFNYFKHTNVEFIEFNSLNPQNTNTDAHANAPTNTHTYPKFEFAKLSSQTIIQDISIPVQKIEINQPKPQNT